MSIVSLIAQKGGVGKTTLAVNLATVAAESGLRVAVVDFDPQATSVYWAELREANPETLRPVEVKFLPVRGVLGRIEALKAEGFDLVLLDTPPKSGDIATDIARASDLMLIPCQPSTPDLGAIASTMDSADNAKKEAYVVINCAPPVGKRGDQAADYIEQQMSFPVAPEIVCRRVDFADSFAMGMGVNEYAPESKAAQETRALFAFMLERLAASSAAQREAS